MLTNIHQYPNRRLSSTSSCLGGRRNIHRLLWTTVLLLVVSFSWLQIRMSVLLGAFLYYGETLNDNESKVVSQIPSSTTRGAVGRDGPTLSKSIIPTKTTTITTMNAAKSTSDTSSSSQNNLDPIPTKTRPSSSIAPRTPMEQMDDFLTNHPETAGARFIHLLRLYMHSQPGMENQRMDACDAIRFPPNLVHCLTGRHQQGTDNNNNNNDDEIAKKAFLPLESTVSVYEMPRYPGTDRMIPSLGTIRSCLPLFLAGSVVGEDKLTLELGPFFGLSSKCMVAGMQTKGVRENSFLAMDTFQGIQNYMSIKNSRQHSWILEEYPFFNWNNSSFLFLWEKAVKPIYPTAQGRAGYILAQTLNPKTIGKPTQDIELISIDSAKSVDALQNQMAGLGPLKAGTILFMLDFEYVSSQIQLVYGCLRETGYLLPVYTAWKGGEGWAFVVTKDFSFSDFIYPTCVTIESERQNHWIEQDVQFLASLPKDAVTTTHSRKRIEALTQKLYSVMEQPFKG